LLAIIAAQPHHPSDQGVSPKDLSRAREAAREQFTKNFRELQESSRRLLREHEAGRLKSNLLSKQVKSIQKCAKNLRALLQLGEPEKLPQVNSSPQTPQAFDLFIRRLASVVSAFAHNPVHRNSKVFNTDDAARARDDLEMIIKLAKLLEDQARNYQASSGQITSPSKAAPSALKVERKRSQKPSTLVGD
jgi:hypothetical protein